MDRIAPGGGEKIARPYPSAKALTQDLNRLLTRGTRFADVFGECRRHVQFTIGDAGQSGLIVTEEVGRSWRRIGAGRSIFVCEEGGNDSTDTLRGKTAWVDEVERYDDEELMFATADALRARYLRVHKRALAGGHLQLRFDWSRQDVAICNSDGACVSDFRYCGWIEAIVRWPSGPLAGTSLRISRWALPGGESGIDQLLESLLHQISLLRSARPARPGRYPVVLSPGMSGKFFHEACGHALEADWAGHGPRGVGPWEIGAPAFLSVADDPTLPNAPGSRLCDDEGFAAARRPLITRGVVTDFLCDWVSAQGAEDRALLPGNARRESFRFAPLPRISNLVVENGPHGTCADIIADTKLGLHPIQTGTASVDFSNGTFTLEVPLAMMIEDGRETHAVSGIALRGSMRHAVAAVERIGSDSTGDLPAGQCLKAGQNVAVGHFAPSVRIGDLDVVQAR